MSKVELKELEAALNYYEVAENLHAGLWNFCSHCFKILSTQNELNNKLKGGFNAGKIIDVQT